MANSTPPQDRGEMAHNKPEPDHVHHIVGDIQYWLDRLGLKIPRALCGASLVADPIEPDLPEDAPVCGDCQWLEMSRRERRALLKAFPTISTERELQNLREAHAQLVERLADLAEKPAHVAFLPVEVTVNGRSGVLDLADGLYMAEEIARKGRRVGIRFRLVVNGSARQLAAAS